MYEQTKREPDQDYMYGIYETREIMRFDEIIYHFIVVTRRNFNFNYIPKQIQMLFPNANKWADDDDYPSYLFGDYERSFDHSSLTFLMSTRMALSLTSIRHHFPLASSN